MHNVAKCQLPLRYHRGLTRRGWLYPEYAAALPPDTSAPRLPVKRGKTPAADPGTGFGVGMLAFAAPVGQLIRQAVRLGGNGFRQAACSSSIGTASVSVMTVSAGNGGTADGLYGRIPLGELRGNGWWLSSPAAGASSLSLAAPRSRQFWQAFVALQSFQIVKNRLLD